MSDVAIMFGFASCFGGLSMVSSLGALRYVYGATSIGAFALALFHGGHPL